MNDTQLSVGTVVNIKCKPGFNNNGVTSYFIECMSTGQWMIEYILTLQSTIQYTSTEDENTSPSDINCNGWFNR